MKKLESLAIKLTYNLGSWNFGLGLDKLILALWLSLSHNCQTIMDWPHWWLWCQWFNNWKDIQELLYLLPWEGKLWDWTWGEEEFYW